MITTLVRAFVPVPVPAAAAAGLVDKHNALHCIAQHIKQLTVFEDEYERRRTGKSTVFSELKSSHILYL